MTRPTRVFYSPAEYEAEARALVGCDVVVFDVLRATSSMITALAHGAASIRPCATVEEAFAWKNQQTEALLAGERNSHKVDGFDLGNSPLEFTGEHIRTRSIIITTSNGTRALRAAQAGERIFISSLLNLTVTAQALKESSRPIAILCAGTHEDFALEDALAASALLCLLEIDHPLCGLYRSNKHRIYETMAESKNGRRLRDLGWTNDLAWCAQIDAFPIAPMMNEGLIR